MWTTALGRFSSHNTQLCPLNIAASQNSQYLPKVNNVSAKRPQNMEELWELFVLYAQAPRKRLDWVATLQQSHHDMFG
jgi:hypothetical protein